jgi:hypothetical protein
MDGCPGVATNVLGAIVVTVWVCSEVSRQATDSVGIGRATRTGEDGVCVMYGQSGPRRGMGL